MACNGDLVEEQDVALQRTSDQEVPHPDVLPDQSAGEFDFNEFFNLEKTMPALASVSTGVHVACVQGNDVTEGVFLNHLTRRYSCSPVLYSQGFPSQNCRFHCDFISQ